MTARAYMPEDFGMVRDWAKMHGVELHEFLLSPNGFIAEHDGDPVLAVWGYLLFDVPVVQLDHLLSAPGYSFQVIREAWDKLLACIKEWIARLNDKSGTNYRILRGFVEPRVADHVKRLGWHIATPTVTHCVYVL